MFFYIFKQKPVMRGTLVLLCTILIFWIGGSSYWYLCKINDHCGRGEPASIEAEKPEVELNPTEDEEIVPDLKKEEAKVQVEAIPRVDSVELAREFISNNPMRTIYFNYAEYAKEISEEDSEYLEMLRIYLDNEPGKVVYLTGHSDSVGTPEGLVFASYQRVLSMTDVLVDAGIDKSRIQSKSLGEGYPIASNSTAQGRAKNRRVEISTRNL